MSMIKYIDTGRDLDLDVDRIAFMDDYESRLRDFKAARKSNGVDEFRVELSAYEQDVVSIILSLCPEDDGACVYLKWIPDDIDVTLEIYSPERRKVWIYGISQPSKMELLEILESDFDKI